MEVTLTDVKGGRAYSFALEVIRNVGHSGLVDHVEPRIEGKLDDIVQALAQHQDKIDQLVRSLSAPECIVRDEECSA